MQQVLTPHHSLFDSGASDRSHVTPQLPPIPPRLGSNPQRHLRPAHDLGSIGTLEAGEEAVEVASTQGSLTLTVCKQCQERLLHAFEHCLNRNGAQVPLLSTHHVNEDADGVALRDAPLFDIVRDPTTCASAARAFEDPEDRIERERWVLMQAKQAGARLDVNFKPRVKGLGIISGHTFSGAIYKRMLDAKEREISTLRSQLHQTLQSQDSEALNVKKLKFALHQSVNYYTFAEEWQKTEASRLQDDIRHLKAEASSLMAFLINSEVEKQGLMNDMTGMQREMATREATAAAAILAAEEMKLRLQQSFRDFQEMDALMIKLRKEALKGSAGVELRNTMLQKNLTKLTADFQIVAQESRVARNKVRELEYELAQMIKDLNAKGEALKKSNAVGAALKDTLEGTAQDLKDLRQAHEHLLLAKAKLEAEMRADNVKNEHQKQDLKKALGIATGELDRTTRDKINLEGVVEVQKGEMDLDRKKLLVLTTERDTYSTTLSRLRVTNKAEIVKRDELLVNLQNRILKDEAQIKTISEKREQLMFQVTDLTNNLEVQTTAATSVQDELVSTKRTSEDKISSLTEQIEKALSSKQHLTIEKRELTEKVKKLRQTLTETKEELEVTTKRWEGQYAVQSEKLEVTTAVLVQLTLEHKDLNSSHAGLNIAYTQQITKNVDLNMDKDAAAKRHAEFEVEIFGLRNTVAALLSDKSEIQRDLAEWKRKHNLFVARYDFETGQNAITITSLENYIVTADATIRDRDSALEKSASEVQFIREDSKTVRAKLIIVENTLSDIEGRLTENIRLLIKETETREILEAQLNENRLLYHAEKKLRADLERAHVRLRHVGSSRATHHDADWKIRDRKLQDVALGLGNEAKRLSDLVLLLPTDGGFGNEVAFVWPEDMIADGPQEVRDALKPTPVQVNCIPPILAGRNVTASARTGSGKTMAFALPIIQLLAKDPFGVFALVMCPTRELCFQIAEQFRVVAGMGAIELKVAVVVGGVDMMVQALELSKKPHIIIATPGRLADHIQSSAGTSHFRRLRFLVLDEADRLLEPSFAPDLERIFDVLPKERQTLLFSATLSKAMKDRSFPRSVTGKEEIFTWQMDESSFKTNDLLSSHYIFLPSAVREAYLAYLLLNDFAEKSTIIFAQRPRTVEMLHLILKEMGVRSTCLHSMMGQTERIGSLAKFRGEIVKVLICTDVGSRGLDIPTVQLVLNFELPANPADYVHRIGRTARAGRKGMSLSMVTERDVDIVHAIEAKTGVTMDVFPVEENPVLELLNAVNVARRVASMQLFDADFGEKRKIQREKQKVVSGGGEERDGREKERKSGRKDGDKKGTKERRSMEGGDRKEGKVSKKSKASEYDFSQLPCKLFKMSLVLEQVKLRIYQYELTTGLYMLEPFEKIVFNSILLIFSGLFSSAMYKLFFPTL